MDFDHQKSGSPTRAKETANKGGGVCDKAMSLLLTIICIANAMYGLAAPFLPVELEAKGISPSMTGVIFAIYAVASVLAALVCGMYLDLVGHRCMLVFGVLLMASSIACFGLIESLTDKIAILVLSVALRFSQGVASGLINTSVYSYVAQAYPDNVEKVVSMSEGFVGIGSAMGPIIGSFIYQAVGFSYTFYFFGVGMAPFALLVCACLSKPKKQAEQEGVDDGENEEEVDCQGVDHGPVS